jgi:nicotinamide phosphoribosyltransferase
MGGGLLQQLNRDTQNLALKCPAAPIAGQGSAADKDPVTDKGKQSKRGRMTLLRHRQLGTFQAVSLPLEAESLADVVKPLDYDDAMVTVRENGHLVHDWSFAEVRSRADATRL